jgi:hypothetical protein
MKVLGKEGETKGLTNNSGPAQYQQYEAVEVTHCAANGGKTGPPPYRILRTESVGWAFYLTAHLRQTGIDRCLTAGSKLATRTGWQLLPRAGI